jgi:hypothetical protein
MPKWIKFLLGALLLVVGIALTALVVSAEIGIPMAIAGIAIVAAGF